MARLPSALLLIGLGAGLLAATRRFYIRGELPAGNNFLRRNILTRADNPVGFRFYLTLYYCAGLAFLVWGILTLLGAADPLRWR